MGTRVLKLPKWTETNNRKLSGVSNILEQCVSCWDNAVLCDLIANRSFGALRVEKEYFLSSMGDFNARQYVLEGVFSNYFFPIMYRIENSCYYLYGFCADFTSVPNVLLRELPREFSEHIFPLYSLTIQETTSNFIDDVSGMGKRAIAFSPQGYMSFSVEKIGVSDTSVASSFIRDFVKFAICEENTSFNRNDTVDSYALPCSKNEDNGYVGEVHVVLQNAFKSLFCEVSCDRNIYDRTFSYLIHFRMPFMGKSEYLCGQVEVRLAHEYFEDLPSSPEALRRSLHNTFVGTLQSDIVNSFISDHIYPWFSRIYGDSIQLVENFNVNHASVSGPTSFMVSFGALRKLKVSEE